VKIFYFKTFFVVAACFVVGCSTGIGLSAEKCFEKGKQKLKENKANLSYKYFDAASRKEPTNVSYHWAAATTTTNQNAAFIHTEAAWKNGLKRPEVLLALSRLSFFTDTKKALEYSLGLFSQLPDSFKTQLLRSEIFLKYEEFDSSLSIALSVFKHSPTPVLCRSIAAIYEKKGDRVKAESFLKDCRTKKMLDGTGYVMLASYVALSYNYQLVDSLFIECRKNGLYTGPIQLEQCGLLLASEQLEKAEKMLGEVLVASHGLDSSLVAYRARIGLAYLYSVRKQPEKLVLLMQTVLGDGLGLKKETAFYAALLNAINDSAGAVEGLRQAQRQLPPNPLISLIVARENLKKGRFKDAVVEYKSLPVVFLFSPRPLVECALALDQEGKRDEAMALLSVLHSHNMFTRQSLELFRDIAFKKRLIEKSMAAQKMLQEKYNNDASVLFSGAVMALKLGKTDSALTLITSLAEKYPKEEKFELAKISILLVKKEYERVLVECRKSTAPASARAPFEARAYRALGRNDDADRAYAAGLTQAKSSALMIEYANFLLESNSPEKAASLYNEILTINKAELKQDSAGNSMLLNNLAWSLLQSSPASLVKAIAFAKQAYEIAPGNPNIIDTYATALIKNGQFKDCIKLLTDNQVVLREPRLLFHLSVALEKNNEINKAVRNYQDVLKLMDASSSALPFTVSASEIKATIEKLIAANK
jgi:predicted Zn-dependent protease